MSWSVFIVSSLVQTEDYIENASSLAAKILRNLEGHPDHIGYTEMESPCTAGQKLQFGTPKMLDKYFGMDILEDFVANYVDKVKAACRNATTVNVSFAGSATAQKMRDQMNYFCENAKPIENVEDRRSREYESISFLLYVAIFVKYGVSSIHDFLESFLGHHSKRSSCDKQLEGVLVQMMSLVLIQTLQVLRCTAYLVAWREGHAVFLHIPETGLAGFVCFHVACTTLNELDKCMNFSERTCSVHPRSMNAFFWFGFIGVSIFCTVPMLSTTYYSFDFLIKGRVVCHLYQNNGAILSKLFQDCAIWSCRLIVIFCVLSVAEGAIWIYLKVVVVQRERNLPTAPSTFSRYSSVPLEPK
mmetsp:Transcript_52125/g.93867  ORF Transcript_52125/g.93867 Transcript_52125/m.93867 type:complete len:357 (-) Transcript_52125:57-1127(-)